METDTDLYAAAFAPENLAAICRAYERALAEMGGKDAHNYLKADLARHVMSLAKAGEFDEERLRERALEMLRAEDDGRIVYSGL